MEHLLESIHNYLTPQQVWLIIYLAIGMCCGSFGLYVHSWLVGLVLGFSFINSVSVVAATLVFHDQPMWVTALIFLVSFVLFVIVLLLLDTSDHGGKRVRR